MISCLTVLLLPLLGSILSGLFGNRFGSLGASILSIFCMFLSIIFSLLLLFKIGIARTPICFKIKPWIYSDMLNINWGLCFDSITVVMLIVVNVVSCIVHIYSYDYMKKDPSLSRFMSYLSLFTFFMLILVTADNFIQLFLGWEGVGLCSFLLISFWCTRLQAVKSALKAFIINRVGDLSLTLGILSLYYILQSIDFEIIFSLTPYLINKLLIFFTFEFNTLTLISLLLFLGAMGKSAQIGLHTWLPDAMEGPTPVSALIHAATMVTAGVFLIIKCSPIIEFSSSLLIFITFIGGLTTFFSSLVGLLQNDIKKVIAYSTCSQLGYMFFICGLSNYMLALAHLFNHAFFKALLFLSAGTLIHGVFVQDMRLMGGMKDFFSFVSSVMLIGSLALGGFPFFSGFYSKDLIIETSAIFYNFSSHLIFYLSVLSALSTSIYSFKVLYLTFFMKTSLNYSVYLYMHNISFFNIILPFSILTIGSLFSGYLTGDFLLGFGSDFFCNAIFILPNIELSLASLEVEYLPLYIKCLPLILIYVAILTILINKVFKLFVSKKKFINLLLSTKKKLFVFYFFFFAKKGFFDRIYNSFFTKIIVFKSYNLFFEFIDKGFLEHNGPTGLINFFFKLSKLFSKYQQGYLNIYLYKMLFFTLTLAIFFSKLFIIYSLILL